MYLKFVEFRLFLLLGNAYNQCSPKHLQAKFNEDIMIMLFK